MIHPPTLFQRARAFLSSRCACVSRSLRWTADMMKDALWPRGFSCLGCGERCHGEPLCVDCRRALDALELPPSQDDRISIWLYDGIVRTMITALKDHCQTDYALILADGMARRILQMELPHGTVLTWVTMPSRRLKERGMDHGRILCQAVSDLTGLPCLELLIRPSRVRTQRGLRREERLRNLQGTFRCPPIDMPVLLIDDVLTTGATATACTEALHRAGARWVRVVTAAHASPKPVEQTAHMP